MGKVPARASVGQAILVPISVEVLNPVENVESDSLPGSAVAELEGDSVKEAAHNNWSTGAKVAAGIAGIAGVAIVEDLAIKVLDATIAEFSDTATSAYDGVADGASQLANFGSDATDSAGEIIMDLF